MKTLILLEMTILAGGGLIHRHQTDKDWWTAVKGDVRGLIAVLVLLTLLLTADEVGFGGAAALFGGLVVLSYLMAAIGWLGPALQSAESELFG